MYDTVRMQDTVAGLVIAGYGALGVVGVITHRRRLLWMLAFIPLSLVVIAVLFTAWVWFKPTENSNESVAAGYALGFLLMGDIALGVIASVLLAATKLAVSTFDHRRAIAPP